MDRRDALRNVAAAGLALLPGCAAFPGETQTPSSDRSPLDRPDREGVARQVNHGFPESICDSSVIEGFSISAITDPTFADDWNSHDIADRYRTWESPGLADGTVVVGLSRGDRARAYPISVLWNHEIVNEQFEGPVLVTYCSLCRSGMVAERTVHGRETIFGVSGQLWRPSTLQARAAVDEGRAFGATRIATNTTPGGNESRGLVDRTDVRVSGNLVMFDELTRSFWSQLLARGICGPKRGHDLEILPSTLTTWDNWRETYPGTTVLLPPPHSDVM